VNAEREHGLDLLEESARSAIGIRKWAESAASLMGLSDKERGWLLDNDLFGFFLTEHNLDRSEKLSSTIGQGLW
jgi:hypothetical protein